MTGIDSLLIGIAEVRSSLVMCTFVICIGLMGSFASVLMALNAIQRELKKGRFK
jgi:hypothetical protein